jgi:glutamate-1-semialdehyde 2,1-aminomutase
MKKKIVAIVQARIGSSRLRGKVLKKIRGKESIILLLERLSRAKQISNIVVAIPNNSENDILYKLLKKYKYNIYRGSENDVLKRYYECAKKYNALHILRVTGDCPLVDSKLVDEIAKVYKLNNYDYVSNIEQRTYPDGMDLEFFSFKTLLKIHLNVISKNDKEHVTKYALRTNIFKKYNYKLKNDNYSFLRITLDTIDDFHLIKKIFENFRNNFFTFKDIINFYKKNNKIFLKNKKNSIQNESRSLIAGQKLWLRAKKSISGGNMLFSKRPDAFLPKKWPSYFSKTKGCNIYDLEGNKYSDFSIMGIGTNILGYSNKLVDKTVLKKLSDGNMSTLNCPEEVELAEKLIHIHPWADQVKFARSGGEANAIAIRLARAYSKKRQKVAFCGYHGWHDWYLAANLQSKKNLNEHLLPGLKAGGVNKELKKTVFPFRYNDFNSLKKIIDKNKDVGIIKMEVIRNEKPKNNFLKKVRKLSTEKNIILIFDECTTGFRQNFGGIHKLFNVEPDMMMLGKALGNGYAITAVLGKKNIMESIKDTFISSTFWTERIGPTAALKTLEVMEKYKTWNYISSLGKYVKDNWKKLAKKHKIDIKINGIDALCSFIFLSSNHQAYKTFITQEMLKHKILATTTIYISISHSKQKLKTYFLILDRLFKIIYKCERGDDIFRYLETDIAESNFARLN